MKKLSLILALIILASFSGCTHEHVWKEATCIDAKICSECGETKGEPLGHNWTKASCTNPKTCSDCKETEGEALGHTWKEATCTDPKTCTTCNITEGIRLGHDVVGLTCTKDGTCSRCNEIIPAVGHKMSAATCTEPSKCSECGHTSGKALGHTTTIGLCTRCDYESFPTISGYGDDVTPSITVGDGGYRIHFTHTGRRNFIVWHYDSNGDRNLLINKIGNYDGYVMIDYGSTFNMEITADGSWTYTIERLKNSSETSFKGKGDYVTNLCYLSSGTYEFKHVGKSNFAVWLHTTDGRDLLINEIGNYSGKKILTIPDGSYTVFQISADGNWTINKVG